MNDMERAKALSKLINSKMGIDHIDWINPDGWLKNNAIPCRYVVYYLDGRTKFIDSNEPEWEELRQKQQEILAEILKEEVN